MFSLVWGIASPDPVRPCGRSRRGAPPTEALLR